MRANVAWLIVLGVFVVGVVALGEASGDPDAPATSAAPSPSPSEAEAEAEAEPVEAARPAPAGPGSAPQPGDGSISATRRALPGQRIGFDGRGFPPGTTVEVVTGTAGGPLTAVGEATADEDGRLSAQVALPDQPATYRVGVRYADGTVAGARTVTTEVAVAGPSVAMEDPAEPLPAPGLPPPGDTARDDPAPADADAADLGAADPGATDRDAAGGDAAPDPPTDPDPPGPGPIRTPSRVDIGGGAMAPG